MAEQTGTFELFGIAFRLWWGNVLLLTLLNILWFAFQVPIISAPIATAFAYVVARQVVDDEFVGFRGAVQAIRKVALPALLWGALNLAVALVVIGNFWIYREEVGAVWALARVVWGAVGIGWFIVNLFYWPFWLAAEEPRLWTTMRNGAVFVVRRPTVGLLSLAILIVSALLTLPFVTAAMALAALFGLVAVDSDRKFIGGRGEGRIES
ncbi:hypothetical protein MNBD_ACTINO02-2722 [hydrothermal vent metagenome]|uniref:DUF624 domain-containing protein n=1 Tax=hydrothermal vent metagenome TaxID=652676 RepID=A0A3B0SY99_9ZZZZ